MPSTKRLSAVGGYDSVTAKLVAMQDVDLEFAPTLVPGRAKAGGSFLLAAQSDEELALPVALGREVGGAVDKKATGEDKKDGIIVPSILEAFSSTFTEPAIVPLDDLKTNSPLSGILTSPMSCQDFPIPTFLRTTQNRLTKGFTVTGCVETVPKISRQHLINKSNQRRHRVPNLRTHPKTHNATPPRIHHGSHIHISQPLRKRINKHPTSAFHLALQKDTPLIFQRA